MICNNPSCKFEFCWICLKETVPHHYEYGECKGKQFVNTETFSYKMKKFSCCVYILLKILIIIGIILIALIIPGAGYTILIHKEKIEDKNRLERSAKFTKRFIFITKHLLISKQPVF